MKKVLVVEVDPNISQLIQIHLKDLGYEVKEASMSREMLYMADEIFFTGTAAEITPVREVDDRRVGAGKPGPITKKIQKAFFDIVRGKDALFAHWLDVLK